MLMQWIAQVPHRLDLALVALALLAFLLLLSWALDLSALELLRLLAFLSGDRSLTVAINRYAQARERQRQSWVARANTALGNLPPPPRRLNTLEGWSWRVIERDPSMTVGVHERSPDGKRLEGYIIGTPGTLQVSCRARTRLKLLEGWITLATEDSPPVTLRAGDSLVIDPGFRGQWQNESIAHLNFSIVLP